MIRPPSSRDGRNLDERMADETGEGATFEVGRPSTAWAGPHATDHATAPVGETYYDLPVVKSAPWRWFIPAYFYAGGLAGAASTLAAAAEVAKDTRGARRMHWIASISEAASAGFLIADLGRPSRFHYMLRVFRPTSPMNLGTWILSAAGASGGLALLRNLRGREGLGVSTVASAISGSMLATYTAVLIGNTAIPVWETTRRRLPIWFAASSSASLASMLELTNTRAPGGRAYSVIAKSAELAASYSVERAAKAAGVDAPLREGPSGKLWRASKWLGVASLGATLFGRSRLGGVLGTAAAVLGRYAIVEAGRGSAADPGATFEPQRRGADGHPSP